ncbi:hypothetical protein GN956_G22781 [Arapaima gigas]
MCVPAAKGASSCTQCIVGIFLSSRIRVVLSPDSQTERSSHLCEDIMRRDTLIAVRWDLSQHAYHTWPPSVRAEPNASPSSSPAPWELRLRLLRPLSAQLRLQEYQPPLNLGLRPT